MTTTTDAPPVTLSEAAQLAWAAKATYSQNRALVSFATQMFTKIKVRRGTYEIDPMFFPDEYNPTSQLGAVVDGLTFCFDEKGRLSVVNWRCAEKNCEEIVRSPFSDLGSLGEVLARGEQFAAKSPKCGRHRKS